MLTKAYFLPYTFLCSLILYFSDPFLLPSTFPLSNTELPHHCSLAAVLLLRLVHTDIIFAAGHRGIDEILASGMLRAEFQLTQQKADFYVRSLNGSQITKIFTVEIIIWMKRIQYP